MSVTFAVTHPEPSETAILQQVQQHWNSGNQSAALDLLRPLAEQQRPWAVALMAWLLMQQGPPGIDESVSWALKAAELGMPWQAVHTFNNAVGHAPSAPQLVDRLPALAQAGLPWGSGLDPIGQAWNLLSQGHAEVALRLMSMSGTWPLAPSEWDSLVATARQRLTEIEGLVVSVGSERDRVTASANEADESITKARDDLETSAKQAGLLVTATLSDATNALFVADAKRNNKESRGAWRAGLAVLGAAAVVAILPLALHYVGHGPEFSAAAQVGAHAASTIALATFAGVLLARARSRDQAAQRANDLSTAMGTMISYSAQISDPSEKERFMMSMGQLVLQAHLTAGSGGHVTEDPASGMLAIANLIRSGSTPVGGPSS